MKIYVITKGCYSDYHICAVATDKGKAELLADKFSDRYESAEIEEYDTDFSETILSFSDIYNCFYHEKEKRIYVAPGSYEYFEKDDLIPQKRHSGLYVVVNADDEEMALKKASDIFAKYRAENLNL